MAFARKSESSDRKRRVSAHLATLELGGTSPIRTPTLLIDDYLAHLDSLNRTSALQVPFDTYFAGTAEAR
jgi:recombinational DNA repair ATPase RecF